MRKKNVCLELCWTTGWNLFIYEKIIYIDDAGKLTVSYTVNMCSQWHLHNIKRKGPSKKHWYGADQIPSEGQVRTSHNSRVLERGKLCIP